MKIFRLRFEFILFLLLEITAITVTIEADKKKSVFMFNTLSIITNGAYTFSYSIKNYLHLKKENQILLKTNKELLNELLNCRQYSTNLDFDVTYAHVLKNTVNRQNNLILLSAGQNQGIQEESGVISDKGYVVGVIVKTSKKYSAALSILNRLTRLSVKHLPSNSFGFITWKSQNSRILNLEDIPMYIKIKVGDTIVTSGYSNIFPEGLIVGYVQNISRSRHANTYTIRIRLAADMSNLTNVFIIKNKSKQELDSLLMQAKSLIGE